MRKKLTLGYLPGGGNKYIETLTKCLEFVQKDNPSEPEFREFIRTLPKIKTKKVVDICIGIIKGLELVVKKGDKLLVSGAAKEFLETHDKNLLYQKLNANYVGISDILDTLKEKPQLMDEISSRLEQRIMVSQKNTKQWKIRLDWLRGLGYVTRIGRRYTLTNEGRSIGQNETEIEEKIPEHSQIQELIVETGKVLGVIAEKEHPVKGGLVLDVVYWETEESLVPLAVFEVNLKENPSEALTRLKQARVLYRSSNLFLVTPRKLRAKAENLLKISFRELLSVLQIVHWTDIEKLKECTIKFKGSQEKVGLPVWFRFKTRENKEKQ